MADGDRRNVRAAALDLLLKIERDGAYSPLALHHAIETSGYEARDAALLTQIVYGTLQHRLTIDYYLSAFLNARNRTKAWVRELLRLSVYQFAYLDKIPPHAITSEAVAIAKKRGGPRVAGFVNAVLRRLIREGLPEVAAIEDELEREAVMFSHPAWLIDRWRKQYGRETARMICQANNEPPAVTARVNRLKASRDEVIAELKKSGIEAEKGRVSEDAIVIKKGKLTDHPVYINGKATVQDESSMLVARALGPQPGMTILDACAAPGGKTTHLAELMNDTGTVVALDIHEHKIGLIDRQAKRLGLTSVTAQALDARRAPAAFGPEAFDGILVDAPCSGFGVIRRKPEIKYQKSMDDVAAIARLQLELLNAVVPLLKKGARLVYSTCTIDQAENIGTAEAFCQARKDIVPDDTLWERLPEAVRRRGHWKGRSMCQILPHDFGTDGFFIAGFVKR
ncbi:16S rRNA (cytosine(967)-C(5))-methyltransferase RsmB [Caenibacillus caldisaponilyticus]|uniref:16S rRNA (cytosine(967)-C(5))-methyltransferase RsmB n=1 Tax=Caenibacillus caldisaponilyticus TaxID=1674942 RepID=UPI0009888238|nr:16S rRNA (cytosine(967)-C(5))-methyltransferase RsmB [Caenibacillus caldisaponilyticus]